MHCRLGLATNQTRLLKERDKHRWNPAASRRGRCLWLSSLSAERESEFPWGAAHACVENVQTGGLLQK